MDRRVAEVLRDRALLTDGRCAAAAAGVEGAEDKGRCAAAAAAGRVAVAETERTEAAVERHREMALVEWWILANAQALCVCVCV